LIDEFQDTSVKQWHNLLPLVTNSLAMGKQNLIVGDAKQSIYRWRGGEVEQFLRLPEEIFQKDLLPNNQEVSYAIARNAHEEKLKFNWRSSQQIVDFNNRFFSKIKELISQDYKSIYINHEQIPMGDDNGCVQIDFSPKDKFSKEIILHKLIAKIEELIELGYNYNDMAILCRTRKDSVLAASAVTEAGIKVISDEALLLKNSPEVGFLVSFLHFLQEKSDKIAKTNIISFLCKGDNAYDQHEVLSSLSSQNQNLFNQFILDNSEGLHIQDITNLPLYDLVEHLIQCFNLESSNIYLQFFLDVILKFSSKISNDLGGFLEWWSENKLKQAIEVSEDSNAVKIMTVHKSKGLEFPIVFIPFNWSISKPSKELWVDVNDDSSNLKVALVRNNKSLEKTNLSEIRTHEKDMSLLDDINVLYVAMTRPINQLYLFIEESSGDKNNFNSLSKLFDYYFKGDDIVNYYEEGKVLAHKSSPKKSNKDSYQLSYNSVKNWREVVHLKNSSNQLWDIELDRKEWGTQLHLWLSKIHYLDQKDTVLKELSIDNSVSVAIKNMLIERIVNIFKNEEIKPFFGTDWLVKTETEILLPSGETYIPDRVIIKDSQVKVIDYKTGSILKLETHKSQLINYANILNRMGYDNIELYLIYIDENIKIVKI
jgi:ATP-dependent exoDNAse (exonuclease V) beta subunit